MVRLAVAEGEVETNAVEEPDAAEVGEGLRDPDGDGLGEGVVVPTADWEDEALVDGGGLVVALPEGVTVGDHESEAAIVAVGELL